MNISLIGKSLTRLRMQQGYKSAREFALKNNLNEKSYWKWESGSKSISMKRFVLIAVAFDLLPSELMMEIEKDQNITPF